MKKAILTLNSGSSSIKFSVFSVQDSLLKREYSGLLDRILEAPLLYIKGTNKEFPLDMSKNTSTDPYEYAICKILEYVQQDFELVSAGHRIVHGGMKYQKHTLIDDSCLAYLETFSPLAALHQPYNLKGVYVIRNKFPKMPQVACFDTAFHTTCNELSQLFAIPKWLTEKGIKRYGFHGLSYEYIVSQLDHYLPPDNIDGKVIIAHLGSGVSMCGVCNRKSVAISIGFSVLEGLPMSTRCGDIDPGVLLHLIRNYNMDIDKLSHLLYKESGLLGVSGGISGDMRELLQSKSPDAKRAVDLFVYRINTWIGKLTAELQGLDALIFTAGIGENSPEIRKQICDKAKWFGIKIDEGKNLNGSGEIHASDSKIPIYVIPTDEERIIAEHTYKLSFK